jgi:DNA-binding NarL/FixJ family response regulator
VVDDYKDWRDQVRSLLRARAEWQVICEVSDGLEAVQKAEELKPDVILLDIGLPGLNGIEAARRIRQISPNSKIIFLSMETSLDVMQVALSTGAEGYVRKADVHGDLLPAIDAVLRGKQFVSGSVRGYEGTEILEVRTSHRHELLFFPDDKTLLDSFTLFIATALRAGNAAILLFTKSHQEMLHQRLKAEHIDVDGAIRQGTFISLDFDDASAKFMAGDSPDPIQYHENFRSLIEAAYKAATAEHPRVACCGEGTGYLCAEGKTAAALRLEQACSSIAKRQNVDMLCAFPSSCLHTDQDKDLLKSICREHSAVHY